MRFGTTITVDGLPVITNVPRGSSAWRKANAIFCPLGPAPMQAWLLMLSGDLGNLDVNAPHTINWSEVRSDDADPPVETTTGLTFPGLYIVNAERLLPGGLDDENALYLVEFSDARYLSSINSTTGPIRANLRSYANSEDFLSGTDSYNTWENLVSALWSDSGLPSSYPGLPPGLPIDGVPQNTWLIGLNAWRALTAVLDQLDCAVQHDPFANTYSIVQLGESQSLSTSGSLKWDGDPITVNSNQAATLRVHFFYHHKSYGQERDTERDNNIVVVGNSDVMDMPTGISGAVGMKMAWDDLPMVFDEDGNQTNSPEVSGRANNRVARYVTRSSVQKQHRIYIGLLNDFIPGGRIRAALWRNWDDGDENDLGGTVTEIICGPQLVTGLKQSSTGEWAWLDDELCAPEREQYGPPDFGRHTFPNFPRLVNAVQVQHSTVTNGNLALANAKSQQNVYFHVGVIRRFVAGDLTTLDQCLILFTDDFDDLSGDVPAFQGKVYGPGRLSGLKTVTTIAEDEDEEPQTLTLPVYKVSRGPLVAWVKVTGVVGAAAGTKGDLVKAGDSGDEGTFTGVVVSDTSQTDRTLAERGPCQIRFVDRVLASGPKQTVAEVGRIYGPATLGLLRGDDRVPVFEAMMPEQEWECKTESPGDEISKGSSGDLELYGSNGASGVTLNFLAKYGKISGDKWCIGKRLNGVMIANQIECNGS